MSVAGIESEIKWVKKRLSELGDVVVEFSSQDLTDAFEDLGSTLEDLFDECQETISSIENL